MWCCGCSYDRHEFQRRQLLGNGLSCRVPPFQCDYSWTDEERDDLWQDMLNLSEPDGEHSGSCEIAIAKLPSQHPLRLFHVLRQRAGAFDFPALLEDHLRLKART